MIIYYNPECSKCNEALNLLNNAGCEVEIRNYLKNPPSVEELSDLINKIGCNASDLIRKKEPLFLEKFDAVKMSDMEILKMLSEYPILIERPIVINDAQAIIGRPPVLVLDLLKRTKK